MTMKTAVSSAIDPKLLPRDGLFLLMRVYPNGSAKYTVRDEAGKQSWLEYNTKMRGGNTLFVNREMIPDTGNITPGKPFHDSIIELIQTIEVSLKERPLTRHYHPDNEQVMEWYGDDLEFLSDGMAHKLFPNRYK